MFRNYAYFTLNRKSDGSRFLHQSVQTLWAIILKESGIYGFHGEPSPSVNFSIFYAITRRLPGGQFRNSLWPLGVPDDTLRGPSQCSLRCSRPQHSCGQARSISAASLRRNERIFGSVIP